MAATSGVAPSGVMKMASVWLPICDRAAIALAMAALGWLTKTMTNGEAGTLLKTSARDFWPSFLTLAIVVFILAACGGDLSSMIVPEACEGVTWGNSIAVEERDGDYIALIGGDFPDSCSTVCGHEQTVEDDTINIDLFSSRPEDASCSSMLTPFTTEVLVETEGLSPGEYTVTLNETHATTTFTLE